MHINKVSIQNLRSIRNFEMKFEQPAGWHVLIGDNGAGKTTILRGIALALMEKDDIASLRIDYSNYLTYSEKYYITEHPNGKHQIIRDRNKEIMYVKLDTFESNRFYSRKFSARKITLHDVSYLTKSEVRDKDKNWKESFSASFGPFRRFTGGNQEWNKLYKTNSKATSHLSLFGEDVALTEAVEWLVNLNYKKLEGREEAETTLESLKTFINEGKLLPHKAKITKVSSDGVFLTDGNGQEVSVNEMSDGFRSILSMTFEIIRQMVVHFGADEVFKSIQKGEIKIDVPGVVLIDEVDAHLHPTWQTEIGFWFTKYFPNIQFIVTTHSPLVCRACERGSIWRLAAPGSGEESHEITGIEKDRLIDGNILDAYGTDLFGQSPARAAKSNEKRKRLGQLNILHALGKIEDTEEKERLELQKTFITE